MAAFLAGLTFEMFIVAAVLFFVLESLFLYSRVYVMNYLLLIPFVVLTVSVFQNADFNYWYLSAYPILSVMWLAAYWYMTMHRTALEISNGISREGSIEKYYDSLPYGNEGPRRHILKENVVVDGKEIFKYTYKVDIQHPYFRDLFVNGLFFLPSIIVFFCDSFFRYVYESLLAFMESVRKSFSDSINAKFVVKVDNKVEK
jgi:hypothetical protein